MYATLPFSTIHITKIYFFVYFSHCPNFPICHTPWFLHITEIVALFFLSLALFFA